MLRILKATLFAYLKGQAMLKKIKAYGFLFEELVKRDFTKKYKRTFLGMLWSVLSPLLTLLIMKLVFTQFFGRSTPHYTIYLFCGTLMFSYFSESTSQGMQSLVSNAPIFTKANVPKYMFLLSKNAQTLINYALTLCVFFLFCALDGIMFTWKFVFLLYPVGMLILFNIGLGLILSALFVFFRDMQYLWSIFTQLLMYLSAIFNTIDNYSYTIRCLFLLNPMYLFIRYFRKIVIDATIPSVWFHLLMAADVIIALLIGCWMYKKYNHKFLYYV
jgi:ABC-2 type transport system permease protein